MRALFLSPLSPCLTRPPPRAAGQSHRINDLQQYHSVWRRAGGLSRYRDLRAADGKFGEFFRSEMVQQEFKRLDQDIATLYPLMVKYVNFDLEGKRIYLEQMDALLERFQIFNTRLKLSDDPLAKEAARSLNVQLLEANANMEAMYEGFKSMVENMRTLLEEEEKISDPVQLQNLRLAYTAAMAGAEVNSILANLPKLDSSKLDMDELIALQDPKAIQALTEVAADARAVEKYRDRPGLYKLLKRLLGEEM